MEERLNSQKKPVLEGEDLRRIADVRRDVWTGGFRGLISGLFLGSASYLLLRKFRPSSFPSTYIDDSKYYILSTLSLGSVGSFMGSLVAGKNSIVFVSDIFQRGAVKNPTAYQEVGIHSALICSIFFPVCDWQSIYKLVDDLHRLFFKEVQRRSLTLKLKLFHQITNSRSRTNFSEKWCFSVPASNIRQWSDIFARPIPNVIKIFSTHSCH